MTLHNSSIVSIKTNFTEPKKRHFCLRKRKLASVPSVLSEDDNISVVSLNNSTITSSNHSEPDIKRKKSLSRVTSLAAVFSNPLTKVGNALQRSLSGARLPSSPRLTRPYSTASPRSGSSSNSPALFGRCISSASISSPSVPSNSSPVLLKRGSFSRSSINNLTPYKPPQPTPSKQRPTLYWSDCYGHSVDKLGKIQVRYQEAIFELLCGEESLINDMHLVQKTYAESLVSLRILSMEEVDLLFGRLRQLPPLHIELFNILSSLRCSKTGVSLPIGDKVLNWLDLVSKPYVDYCSGLISIKAFLDAKRETDRDFADFLQRCIESPFSRKLDLWSYLDVPRSHFVKYPLLLKQICKYSESTAESAHLHDAISRLESILQNIDSAMARASCQFTLNRLEWLDENDGPCQSVLNATEQILQGTLRNNRGTKLQCYLLDTVLILTRPSSRGSGVSAEKRLQVYRRPIPVSNLTVENVVPGDEKVEQKSGSFKSAFSSASGHHQSGKNCSFRVGFINDSATELKLGTKNTYSYTLSASDDLAKRQWVATIEKLIAEKTGRTKPTSIEVTNSCKSNSTLQDFQPVKRKPLFKKHKSSPVIKSTLSHNNFDNLRRVGSMHKIRRNAVVLSKGVCINNSTENDVNSTKIPPESKRQTPLIVENSRKRRQWNSSVILPRDIHSGSTAKRYPIKRLNPVSGGVELRSAKSCGYLFNQLGERNGRNPQRRILEQKENITPRYVTRSFTQMSKSMNDLIET